MIVHHQKHPPAKCRQPTRTTEIDMEEEIRETVEVKDSKQTTHLIPLSHLNGCAIASLCLGLAKCDGPFF